MSTSSGFAHLEATAEAVAVAEVFFAHQVPGVDYSELRLKIIVGRHPALFDSFLWI